MANEPDRRDRSAHPVTMRDVARVAGVSVATVSHVVNDKASRRDALDLMNRQAIDHLPVLDDAHNVVGIVSIGDMIKETISQQKFIISQLENYITG